MTTPFSTIYDQFMQFVTDYRLVTLYTSSPSDFEIYMSGFLIPAITDFKNCNQSLSYSGTTFDSDLNIENVKILALLMEKYWLVKNIDDITQMNLHVQDRDFKIYAESNNMTAKQSRLSQVQETLSQMFVDYALEHTNWSNWFAGNYYIP